MIKRIALLLRNLLAVAGALMGIYQGYVAFETPKADLVLVTSSADFALPKEIGPAFDGASAEDRAWLGKAYSLISKYSSINSLTHAGLHNEGDKSASDIRITFPGAQFISVESQGREAQFIKGNTSIEIQRLLPNSSVYFIVWGEQSNGASVTEPVSGVHSEGIVKVSKKIEVLEPGWIDKNFPEIVLALLLILGLIGVWLFYD